MNLFENLQLMKEADEYTRYQYTGPVWIYDFKSKRCIGEIRDPIYTASKTLSNAYKNFIDGIIAINNLFDYANQVQIDKNNIKEIDSFPKNAENNLPVLENINMHLLKEEDTSDSAHIYKIKFKLDTDYIDNMLDGKHADDKVSIHIKGFDFSENYSIADENQFIKEFEEWYNDGDELDIHVNYIKCNEIDDTNIEYEISLKNKLNDENEFLYMFFDFFDESTITVDYVIDGKVVSGEDYHFGYDGPNFFPIYSNVYDEDTNETMDIEFEYKTIEKIK